MTTWIEREKQKERRASMLARARNARADYDRQRARLYRSDGDAVYGESEMLERLAALQADLDATVTDVEDELRAEEERIRRAEAALARDALDRLAGDELIRATQHLQLVRDDVERRPLAALSQAVDALIGSDDRALLAVYERLCARWVETHREQAVTGQLSARERERIPALQSLAARLSEHLRDPQDDRRRDRLDRDLDALKPIRDEIAKARGLDRESRINRILAQAGVTLD